MHNQSRAREVHQIIDKAAAESAIVSSLYPSGVRDRLIHSKTVAKESKPTIPTKEDAFKNDINHAKKMDGPHSDDDITSLGIYGSMPIAELYPNTTIM